MYAIRSIFAFTVIIFVGYFGCQKNILNDADDIAGEWYLNRLIWTQNKMEISIEPAIKGYEQTIDFKTNGSYISETTYIQRDTTIVESGQWSIKNNRFTFKPDAGEKLTGDYILTYYALSITLSRDIVLDVSGIPQDIPVTLEYRKKT